MPLPAVSFSLALDVFVASYSPQPHPRGREMGLVSKRSLSLRLSANTTIFLDPGPYLVVILKLTLQTWARYFTTTGL